MHAFVCGYGMNIFVQVCVETCPNSTWMWYSQHAAELINNNKKSDRDQMICKYTVNAVTSTKVLLVEIGMFYAKHLLSHRNTTKDETVRISSLLQNIQNSKFD